MNWNITSRDIIRAIRNDNWEHVATDGSHWQFKHTKKKGRVRINISVPKSLLQSIDSRARQLGIDRSKLLQKAAREVISIVS